jgi:hypothetical protein
MQHLDISICADAADAIAKGHVYRAPETKAITIDKVIVIRSGTEAGNSTVDLLLKDEAGNQFVVMVTGNLLKSIPC